MSFSAMVKHELCRLSVEYECCQKAQAYGLMLFGNNFDIKSISMQTENAEIAHLYAELAAQLSCSYIDIDTGSLRKKQDGVSMFRVSVPDEQQRTMLLNLFGHKGIETNHRINFSNLDAYCCKSAFVRGVFLSCGTISNPTKEYHLEFTIPYYKLCSDFMQLLSSIDLDIEPKVVNRKGAYVVYLKESESITDLLTYMGATNASMEIIQVKMLKEVRNNVNRKLNFETANIDKTVQASAIQIGAIKSIIKKRGMQAIPEELQELAQMRIDNPELSLRELGESLSVPISRSGVNHRIKKLMDLAEQLT